MRSPSYFSISSALGANNQDNSFQLPEPATTPVEESTATIPVREITNNTQPAPQMSRRLPQPNVQSSIDSILAQAESIQAQLDARSKQEQPSLRDTAVNNYMGAASENLAEVKQGIRDTSGIEQKEEQARNIFNRIRERDISYRDQIEAIELNPEGKLRGALNAQINDVERNRSREMADLSFAYQVANGDFMAAQQVVNNRIADLEADRQARMDMWKQAYDFAMNDETEGEKRKAQENFQKQMKEWDFAAQQEMALFNDKLARERSAIAFNREQAAKQQEMMIAAQAQAAGDAAVAELAEVNRIKFIDDITALSVHDGLNSSVGPIGLGRIALADVGGAKDDFIGQTENIVKTLTLNTFAEAKEKGMTFGAMTNEEWRILAESATKISNWREMDSAGNVVGYDIDEDSFKRELDTLSQYAKLDAVLKGTDPKKVGVEIMSDGTYWTSNSDGTLTRIR